MVMTKGIRRVTEDVDGKYIAKLIVIQGQELHVGHGQLAIHNLVGVMDEDGNVVEYLEPPKDIHFVDDINTLMDKDFDDGQGGTVKGSVIFSGMVDMCNKRWSGEINQAGEIVEI